MENRPSLTAAGIAILRAVESEKPAGERLFYDPYASKFVNPWLFMFTALFLRIGYADRRGPGVQGFLLARTRSMDDFLLACVASGCEPVVILGAGYDARAYRFAPMLAGKARVFEVDHPATQADKLARLKPVLGEVPEHVTYVAIDFNRETLDDRLPACGYDEKRKTVFIWEGVTMYLTPAAVDATLAFIACHAAPGSSVVFDYVYSSVIEGYVRRNEATGMRRYRRLTGEEMVFGITEGTARTFLEQRGFGDVQNVTARDLQALYFAEGARRGKQVAPVYAIAAGTVMPR